MLINVKHQLSVQEDDVFKINDDDNHHREVNPKLKLNQQHS